ncbi:NmrA family NAD(P)-binding protein [Solimonas marina]|uniref:NmrA family NAD(P)-binding protein n=1 Tax=Solimonas marina TaxID=2714601 RepID=A0A970BAM4_9GAMM|nr:NmrA family NAD(P)-binding protein [Solimonas marina]NKF23526.1 NmrA family NAD(P)-binding protein [Solimonas marina]
MITVFGATGTIGQRLCAELSAADAPYRCAVRDPARALAVLPAGARCVQADMQVPASLMATLQGVQALFLLSSHDAKMAKNQIAVIDAAVTISRSRTPLHIVKLSGGPYMRPELPLQVSRQHLAIEDALQRSGLPYTILRPAFLHQNLLRFASRIAQHRELTAPFGEQSIAMVDADDVAAAAARILLAPGGHDRRTYSLTGERAWRMQEIAQTLSAVVGHRVRYRSPPVWLAGVAQRLAGVDAEEVKHNLEMVRCVYRAGLGAYTSTDLSRLLGRAPRTMQTFLERHRAAFVPS